VDYKGDQGTEHPKNSTDSDWPLLLDWPPLL
jgi:hypothetical protein